MIKSINKNDGEIVAERITEILADANAIAAKYPEHIKDSIWRGSITTSLEDMMRCAKRGIIYTKDV